MKIIIESILHSEQRYETAGDWYYDDSGLHIRVSAMKDKKHEYLVAIHELIEVLLCEVNGVPQSDVDKFDMDYEHRRLAGDWGFQGEPGDDKNAPYRREHCFATAVERMMAAEMNVGWTEYDEAINDLYKL